MEQQTCNIIMCRKKHCRLKGATGESLNDIAVYVSRKCGCDKKIRGRL